MKKLDYCDFDLLITRDGHRYSIVLVDSPVGGTSENFELPFSQEELQSFNSDLRRARSHGSHEAEVVTLRAGKDFGHRLFKALFHEDILQCLGRSLDRAKLSNKGLRIKLQLSNVPELIGIPWEYLYDSNNGRFLSLSVQTPIVRYLAYAEPPRALAVESCLKVLVMVSSPKDYETLDTEKEWESLKQSLKPLEKAGKISIERLPVASMSALQSRLRTGEYHIFHFVGHGDYDENHNTGVLIMEDKWKMGHSVSGQQLGMLLHDERTIRLAVINACKGSKAANDDPFSGIAQNLLRQSIPAVVAMQYEITDKAAVVLAREFYGALADGFPVDASLAEARKAISMNINNYEWATPVLYMRSPDGVLFNTAFKSPHEKDKESMVEDVMGDVIQADKEDKKDIPAHITRGGKPEFCRRCGAKHIPSTMFCRKCGTAVKA